MNYSGHGISHDHQHLAVLNSIVVQESYYKIEYWLRDMARDTYNIRIVSIMNCCSESITNYKDTELFKELNVGRSAAGGIPMSLEDWEDKLKVSQELRFLQLMMSSPGGKAGVDS